MICMNAYVSILSDSEELNNILILSENLKQINSNFEFICLISKNINYEVQEILRYFDIKFEFFSEDLYTNFNQEEIFFKNLDILGIFLLEKYNKIIYLDNSLIVLKNIDYMFNLSDNFFSFSFIQSYNNYNIDFFVVSPSIVIYNNFLKEYQVEKSYNCYDLLNNFFKDNAVFLQNSVVLKEIIDRKIQKNSFLNKDNKIFNIVKKYNNNTESEKIFVKFVGKVQPYKIDYFDDELMLLYKFYQSIVDEKKYCYKLLNNGELVSIILINYNQGRNLKNCINSVLNQTYKNIELIVIDNKSVDDSIDICESYLKNDCRVKHIINSKTDELLYSKIFGISKASGKYFLIVEATDILECSLIEKVYCNIKKYNLDFCQFGIKINNEDIFLQEDDCLYEKKEKLLSFISYNSGITYNLYDKMISLDIVKKNIDLNNYNYHFDYCFILDLLKNTKNIGIISDILYLRYQNNDDFFDVKMYCQEYKFIDKTCNYLLEECIELEKEIDYYKTLCLKKLFVDLLNCNQKNLSIYKEKKFQTNFLCNINKTINELQKKYDYSFVEEIKCYYNVLNSKIKINYNKKIIMIMPYFCEKFPNYFNLYLNSVKYNETIDFLLITNCHDKYDYPKNMRVIYTTFESVKNKIKQSFDFNVEIDTSYKICDYRPFYATIFKEYVIGYDYVGYGDIDVIYGDIRKFLNFIHYEQYDKIFKWGNFTLIKNDENLQKLLLNARHIDGFSFYDVVNIGNVGYAFDELNGITPIFTKYNLYQYLSDDFIANINCLKYNFRDFFNYDFYFNNQIYYFIKGKLYGELDNGLKKEFMYIHLQKRKMENYVTDVDRYYIVPNRFVDYKNFDKKKEFDFQKNNDIDDDEYGQVTLYNEKKLKKMYDDV